MSSQDAAYASRLDEERRHYDGLAHFDDLPPIYHYWSHTFIRPMLEEVGCSRPAEFFARYLDESAGRCSAEAPVFASIGSGDANNELEIARLLCAAGRTEFTIECLEINPALIERASAAAREAGLERHLVFVQQDFNTWRPLRSYHGVFANQSLHHVTNLEGLFDAVRGALAPDAYFVASDIIGRNGHQRWPEARRVVEKFWRELPPAHRFHRQLARYEAEFEDWDCSREGFEGIRSQDVLPLLLERFHFAVFIGFGSAIDPFVDRGFGPNFDAAGQWDRAFIDRVHACDERGLLAGYLTPTHVMAVLATQPCETPHYARGLSPQACVRPPDRIVSTGEMERTELELFDGLSAANRWLPLRGRVRQEGEVRGWHEDDWAGESLEFTVVPEVEVPGFLVHVTCPPSIPAGTTLSVAIDGIPVQSAFASPDAAIACTVKLAAGAPATIRISTTATVNLKALGLGDDERDLGFHLDSVVFNLQRGT